MGTINLANSKGRDAMVATESVATAVRVRWVDPLGRSAIPARILRGTADRDLDALIAAAGGADKVADLLVKDDPEIDFEAYGMLLGETSRVWIGPDKKVIHQVAEWEVVRNPEGSERERRPRQIPMANTGTEVPLRWSGKLLPKSEVVHRFVLQAKMQIVHVNGLTYDFLFAMARELEQKQAMLVVGAGPRANQPLVFQRGGTPYRGFLEGRTQGERYLLVLHLSNLELRAP